MTSTLRRGGALSFLLHAAVLFAVVTTLRPRLPPEPDAEETAVTVQFEAAPTPGQRAPAPAPTPAPPASAPTPALPASTPAPPTPEPPSPPPPDPAPPPPPLPAPPAPTPPPPPAPAPPRPPVPAPPPPPPSVPPAPEQSAPAPLPAPPIPPPPPAPRQPAPLVPTSPPPPARPAPPVPTPPAPPPPNPASQPNPARPPAPDSKSLESTLDRLRAQQASKEPPRAPSSPPPSPPRASAPAGGSPAGIDNALLTGEVRRAIGERLRECWIGDKSALNYEKQSVRLVVTTDSTGTIRVADIAANDASRTSGGVARAFAERARRAALDPQCAQLPLPGALKGQNRTFEITFRP